MSFSLPELINRTAFTERIFQRFRPLLKACCDVDLQNQPSARTVHTKVVQEGSFVTGEGHKTLIEKIIWRLSKHSEDLEDQVERRTIDLLDERHRCDSILSRFLPEWVLCPLELTCTPSYEIKNHSSGIITLIFLTDLLTYPKNIVPIISHTVGIFQYGTPSGTQF